MKTKVFLTLAVLGLAFLVPTPPAMTAGQFPVFGNVSSDTAGSVAALVKYVGTTAGSATTDIAVAAGGVVTFRVAGVASTTVNSAGTCAAVVGTMDPSDADCDTFGEFADIVNATADWRMVLVSALRTDSTNDTITTFAVAAAQRADGVALYFDSAVSLTTSIALIPEFCKTDIRCFMDPSGKLKENPYGGQQTEVRWIEGYSTFATTGTFNVYSVKPRNKASGSESVSTIYSEVTGITGTLKQLTQFQYFGLLGRPHEKVIVRITDTGASSAFFLRAYGYTQDVQ